MVADGIMMMPVLAFRAQLPPLKTRHKEFFQVFETDCRGIPQRMKFFSKRENTLSCGGGCYQWLHWQRQADLEVHPLQHLRRRRSTRC